jgi:hypothetical protein
LAFGGLVVLTLRNHLPFTCVHSHAVAQKSSGAFFRDTVRKVLKRPDAGLR